MKKTVFVCMLVSILTLPIFAAGGKESQNTDSKKTVSAEKVNPPGVFPICKEKTTITIGIVQNANVENYDTNKATLWYAEKGNFDIKFEFFPQRDAAQKLAVMISSGSKLPDILVGFDLSAEALLNYGREGAIIPLNEYYDKWASKEGINWAFESATNKNLKKWITSSDGNIYMVPKGNEQIGNNYSLRSWINKTWLDRLGLPMPKTTEDLRKVLQAFVTMDPNGNGKKDEIGMIGSTAWRSSSADFLMNAFIYNDTLNRFIVKNGKIQPVYNTLEWKEGLQYINSLIKEGLLLPQSFTMDATQARQLTENGDLPQVGVITSGNIGELFGATNKRKLDYVPLPPLVGPRGANYSAFFPVTPISNFMITKDAKNPEALFRLADLMCTEEGLMRTRWGVPDVDWKKPEPGDKSVLDRLGVKAKIVPILPWGSIQNSHWYFTTPGYVPFGYADGQVPPKNDPLYSEIWIGNAVPYYINKEYKDRADILIFTLEEMEQIRDLRVAINTFVNESLALFSVGSKNVEKDWETYIKQLESLNLKKYLELSQSGYKRATEN